MYVLLIDADDYEPPDVHGPFESIAVAQQYARGWREKNNLPHGHVEPTSEENDEWTEAGWYFGIFEPIVERDVSHEKRIHGRCEICGHYGSDCTGEYEEGA